MCRYIVRVKREVSVSVNVSVNISGGVTARVKPRLGLRLYARSAHSNMYTYAYECRNRTTPPSTSKVQRRESTVVLQALRQFFGSLVADAVACRAHARLLSFSADGQLNTDEQTRTHTLAFRIAVQPYKHVCAYAYDCRVTLALA